MPPLFDAGMLFPLNVNPLCENCLIWLGIFIMLLCCYLISRCVQEDDNVLSMFNCFAAVFFTACTWLKVQYEKSQHDNRDMWDFCDSITYVSFGFCASGLSMFMVFPLMRRRLPNLFRDMTADVCASISRRLTFVIAAVIWSLNFDEFAENLRVDDDVNWQFVCASLYFILIFFAGEILDIYMTRYGMLSEFSWFVLCTSGTCIVYHWYWLEINSFESFPWNAVTLSGGVYVFSRMLLLYGVPTGHN
ncbi:protein E11 [Elephant endotheliotropic herpesvirus 1A]|uniref:Membrane protein EE38 n=2 Tax=Elephantid herpesvirus 1 TaxID=146015 RepID=M4JX81_ELHV1|nr:membrane protein EE38 [Elephantid betaherpesvirus 1]AGG16030.1 protein E11 [Elephant endotheliotropic herpesvirus 1A]AGE09887.1 membrane protein EE38 [Elephantid betaherpesvirus 1]AGE09996.1 membrane protein EE38 [Elephantid betaherpesvirus 1]QYM88429.1 protein E11 [Elephant endotheliotropic herpesvirus 1A]WES72361.1 protein E11 [Elephantid betaherpesvirus 1]